MASMVGLRAIRGPPHFPLVGALPFFMKNGGVTGLAAVHRKLYEYGNIVSYSLAGREMVAIFDPVEFLKVHRAEGRTPLGATSDLWFFHHYYALPRVQQRWKAWPLAFSEGEEWRRQRHALQKGLFGHQDVLAYLPAVNEMVDEAAAELPNWIDDLQEYSNRVTFQLITGIMLGTNAVNVLPRSGVDPRDERFVQAANDAMDAGNRLLFSPLGKAATTLRTADYCRFEKGMDYVLQRADELLQEQLEGWGDAEPGPAAPYAQKMMASGALTREEVVLNVNGLVQGGVDTTASSLNWLIVNLAANPVEQERVAQELQSVLGDGPFDMEALPKLPLMKAAIRESHRLTPTVFGTLRVLDEPIDLVDARRGGATISLPAKTSLSFSSVGFSLDPALVEAPDEFRLDRWTTPKGERSTAEVLDHKLMSQPFSFGPRMCLGARLAYIELYTVLARFVRQYHFSLDPPSQKWGVSNHMMTYANPFPKMRIERRTGP